MKGAASVGSASALNKPMRGKRAKPYPANTVDPETGKRQRIFHGTRQQARVRAARDLARRAMLEEKLGDVTIACVAAEMRAGYLEDEEARLIYKIDRAMKRIGPLCGDILLRRLDRHGVKTLADKLELAAPHPETFAFFVGWLCRIIRHGFGDLEPPVRTPGDIPGRRVRGPYGLRGPQFNDKPIPYGPEITDRLEKSSGVLRILLHILLRCGLRIGEALALRRCDVVFVDAEGKGWLHVRKSLNAKGNRKDTKTKAGKRDIPLPAVLAAELKAWFEAFPAGPMDQAITDAPGRRIAHREARTIHDRFQKTLAGRMFGFHRYRAGCVTAWLVSGVRLQNIQTWIGHSSIEITVMIYASSLAFADELWWRVHEKGKYANSPGERVRLSLVIGGKPEADETDYAPRRSAPRLKEAA